MRSSPRTLVTVAVAALLAEAFIACSSETFTTAPAASDASVADAAGGDEDASAADANDGSDAPRAPRTVAAVSVSEDDRGTIFAADFFTEYSARVAQYGDCSEHTFGGCSVRRCTTADAGDTLADGGHALAHESAGTITLSGGKLASPATLTPAADNMYPYPYLLPTALATGDTFAVSAAGATVPAFALTATAPSTIVVTQPTIANGKVTLSLSSDLVIGWTGATTGSVLVQLTSYVNTLVIVDCEFFATSGQGVIPVAALADLAPTGLFSARAISKSSTKAGDYEVTFALARNSTGAPYKTQ